jgi:N-dimethylarginine dimethylaminohydrolase
MSILLGNCNSNIDNYYLNCGIKQIVIQEIINAFNKLGTYVIQVQTNLDEVIWIRDIYVPIDNIYLKCNLTKNSTMNTDRSIEYDYIKKFLNTEKKIIEIPDNILFEGGDIIQEGNYMFVGISSRTNIQIVTILKDLFPNKNIIPIHHTALHLDCCFCILDNKLVFYDSKYIENISLPNKFTIFDIASIVDSGKYMATNFVQVGNTLIMSKIKKNAIFRKILRDIGYKIILINTQNIWKEGGSIRCLTQWL